MIQRYPKNPRYLEYNGTPILSVGSGEHYGAVLNADFDFVPYLNCLAAAGLNQCRVFSGVYRELPGEFGIVDNTLAPGPERFLCPWQRRDGKWDLTRWNSAYWQRLKRFVSTASKKKILVEYVLFCHWYNDALWSASPLHPGNNHQGVGPLRRGDVYRAEDNALWPYFEALVRKAAELLQPYGNVYFEIANEPYIDHGYDHFAEFHRRVAEALAAATPRSLIALNFANRTGSLPELPPQISLVNFHYAIPEAVHDNSRRALILADDETGFAGQSAEPYRQEAWRFFLAGGAMFSHLDYSFTVAHPDGTAPITGATPGYGGADLRQQLGFLRKTLEAHRVWDLIPRNEAVDSDGIQVLASADQSRLVVYLAQGGSVALDLAGSYRATWYDPVACRRVKEEARNSGTWDAPERLGEAVLTLEKESR